MKVATLISILQGCNQDSSIVVKIAGVSKCEDVYKVVEVNNTEGGKTVIIKA
jgi:hypothetical protein